MQTLKDFDKKIEVNIGLEYNINTCIFQPAIILDNEIGIQDLHT